MPCFVVSESKGEMGTCVGLTMSMDWLVADAKIHPKRQLMSCHDPARSLVGTWYAEVFCRLMPTWSDPVLVPTYAQLCVQNLG